MDRNSKRKLIIVEGLTGSGKSIMAHFIARQLGYNGIESDWVHEGQDPHPLLIEVESSVEDFMQASLENWKAFVRQIQSLGQVMVVEACFFNNLIESLFTHNVARLDILRYYDRLQKIIEPLQPALVYLRQDDVARALERNFRDRGRGFENYVIQYVTGTSWAKQRGLEGYEGMEIFWREFAKLTDELFHRSNLDKLTLENSAGDWARYNRQVLAFLTIPLVPEPAPSSDKAAHLVGSYKDEKSDRRFVVQYGDKELTINFFLQVKTRLIPKAARVFYAEGWPFEVRFREDNSGQVNRMEIGGKDIDYVSLVDTVAVRVHLTRSAR